MGTPDDPVDQHGRTEFTPDGSDAQSETAAASQDASLLGSRIGPYTLIERIGEGGMGEVFLAEQSAPISRRVAIKLIRQQLVDGLSLAYFEIERQALARMDHPAIARVYEAGRTTQGFPYFAMEYVEGISLARWCAESNPDRAARLRMFITLVRGVEHSHQRGIVHRDLKPDNVLVTMIDGQPYPKLIDFGIAIGIDQGGTSGAFHRAGSADYMSPEQFASQHAALDARSDVFSLGRMLLGMLVPLSRDGQPTQRPTELHARLRASLAGAKDPDLHAVPTELRHLLARAMATDPNDRYDSAGALAEDVQRFIDGRTLRAVPGSRAYQMRKFAQRNRLAVGLASAALFAVVAGLGATLWALAAAEREADSARASANFLTTVLASVNPDVARDLDKTLLRKVLDEAAARANRELAAQPRVRSDVMRAIIDSYLGLGDYGPALEHATSNYRATLADYGPESRVTVSAALPLSEAIYRNGRSAEAEAMLLPTVAFATRAFGADDEVTLRLRNNLGLTLRDLGRSGEALPHFVAAASGLRATLGADAAPTVSAEFARTIALADLDRHDEAIPALRALIEQEGAIKSIDHPSVLTLRNSLAVYYMQSRRYADGERELKALLGPYAAQYGDHNSMTLMIKGNLAGALRQQGKVDESGPYYLEAMLGNRGLYGTDHPRSIMTLHNYGNWLLDAGRTDDAERAQVDALAAVDRALPDPHPTRAEILTSLGKVRTRQGRFDEAERYLLQSVELKTTLRGPTNSRLFQSREALRELYTAWNRPDEVARYAEPVAAAKP